MTSSPIRYSKAPARDNRTYWAESRAQEQIVSFLRRSLPPYYRVIAIPNGRFKADPKTIARLKREGLTPGVYDLMILRNDGWFAQLEVKNPLDPKADRSDEQIEWGDWLSSGGANVAVVRSLAEAEAALVGFGVPLRGRVAA